MAKFRAAGKKRPAPQRQSAIPCLVLLLLAFFAVFAAIYYSIRNPQ